MADKATPKWHSLISHISYLGKNNKEYTKEIASLRRGNNDVTEHYAYPYVLPYTEGLSQNQKTALVRIAATLAEYPEIPAFSQHEGRYSSFGSWCYQVSKRIADDKKSILNPDKPDLIGQRLAYLYTQPLEEAVLSIRRLLALASSLKNPPALNKHSLARTLIYWGNGISPESRRIRMRILRDYYSSFSSTLD